MSDRPCSTRKRNEPPGFPGGSLAVMEGFEPPVGCPTLAFEASSFGRSDTSPPTSVTNVGSGWRIAPRPSSRSISSIEHYLELIARIRDFERSKTSRVPDSAHADAGLRPLSGGAVERRVGPVRDFAELMRAPGLGRIIATQLAARFPAGMYSLGLLMHVEHAKGNYTAAGLVLAAFSIGMAVAGPFVASTSPGIGTAPVLLGSRWRCRARLSPLWRSHRLPLWALMGLAALRCRDATGHPDCPNALPATVPSEAAHRPVQPRRRASRDHLILGPVLINYPGRCVWPA